MRIFLLGFLLMGLTAHGQMVQKCCGTGNSTFLLGNLSTASHSQVIYTPSDLTGAQPGDINRLYFRYGNTGAALGNTLTNFMVRFVQNTASSFTNNFFFTGLDTVFMAPSFTIPPGVSGDWFAIDLDSTFPFDETLTIVVDISFTGSSNTGFGTASTSMAGRKLYWNNITSPTGQSVVSSYQDVGFDLMLSTGIDEEQDLAFRVIPNPTSDMATLKLYKPLRSMATLEVYSTAGVRLWGRSVSPGISAANVDLSEFPAGMYVAQLTTVNGFRSTERIVKQ